MTSKKEENLDKTYLDKADLDKEEFWRRARLEADLREAQELMSIFGTDNCFF